MTRGGFGIGPNVLIVPVGMGKPLKVKVTAPGAIKRKDLLKGGVRFTLDWGAVWGQARVKPIFHLGHKTVGDVEQRHTQGGYSPGELIQIKPTSSDAVKLVRRGAPEARVALGDRWPARRLDSERYGGREDPRLIALRPVSRIAQ